MNNSFVTSVELHAASEKDYLTLHVAMGNLGFSRIVVSASGSKHYLPNAEYVITTNSNVTAVRDLAKRAANSTGRTSWILATQSAGMAWDLPLVK